MDPILNKIYYDPSNPAGYQSLIKLHLAAKKVDKNITINDVKSWLLKQDTYTLHKTTKRKFPRSRFISKNIDDNWQADLVEISNPQDNKSYKYLLMVIDVLSKYGWIRKLKDKKPKSIIYALNDIFVKDKRHPKIFTTDAGTEFVNIHLKRFLMQNNIKHFIARNTEVKAAVVERWNRTIKEKLSKYMTANNTSRFINIIENVVDAYNNSLHSRTKFKPVDVTSKNQKDVYYNLYKTQIIPINNQLKIGDQVRIQKIKNKFEKGYKPNWTKEIFRIEKILNTIPYPRYILSDNNKESLIGSFYPQELQVIKNGIK